MQPAAFAAEKVDQSNLPEWAGGWTHINPDPNGQASMWQTFTPNYSNITAVEIDIFTINTGQFDDILTFEIAKDGEILVSTERNVEYGFEGLLRFEFAEAVAVVPGELYELKVRDTGLTRFGWKYASNSYDGGSRYVFGNERPGTDWFFQTYSIAEPCIIYVDDDAAGANDGSSWENAYTFLQDALADANSADKPVEILVAQGIYKPYQGVNQTPGDREATFQLLNETIIKGGYAGFGEPDPNDRYVDVYETILSGDLAGNDISWNELLEIRDLRNYNLNLSTFNEPKREDNTYHVVIGSGTDETAVLDGFIITGGCAADFDYSGGGMYNDAGNPTIVDCTFTRNLAYYSGGGIYCKNNSNPTLTNCTISKNWALYGGGMDNENSNPSLTNCIFTENFSEVHYDAIVESGYSTCGGMHNSYSNPTLTDCTFSKNSSSWILADSAGGMLNYRSNPNMTNCFFNGNIGCRGGGIYNKGSNPILTNCVFIGNLATNGSTEEGGAIFTDFVFYLDRSWTSHLIDSNPILTNCIFIGNFAEDGAGIYNLGSSRLVLSNCIFSSNKAISSGGGIYNRGGRAILTNCTFVQHSSQNGNALGCDEYYFRPYSLPDSNLELINCILWNGGNEIWNNDSSIVNISYSDIQGGQASIYDPCEAIIWGEGNIDVDPDFVRAGYWTQPSPRQPNSSVWIEGDYHLKSEAGRWDTLSESWVTDNLTSPCIDAGDPNSPVAFEPEPNGGRINMGAYGGTAEASKSPAFSWWLETTQGPVPAEGLGIVLPHEHIFTDLRGPTTPGYGQADAADVVRVMSPLLADAREKGVGVLIECTGIGVGRNVAVINQVAESSGLPVVVPTGVYGRANFAPPEHQNMTEDELATLFVSEIRDGIEGTGIKAGFIKIATDEGPMNALLEKILRAAGRAASETGAAIASHTPTGSNAVRQVDILESIDPAIRFIWVHAQNESNRNLYLQLAARGVYIEFDSLGWNPSQDSTYISAIKNLLAAGHGDRILLSHDAGWYQPGSVNGGTQMPYTYLIDTFIPKLRDAGVDDATIRMITQTNPVRAFGFKSGE